jgi:hypothetical protein
MLAYFEVYSWPSISRWAVQRNTRLKSVMLRRELSFGIVARAGDRVVADKIIASQQESYRRGIDVVMRMNVKSYEELWEERVEAGAS